MTAEIKATFREALNRHGYGLQSAVAQALRRTRGGRFTFAVRDLEIPVVVQGRDMAIDVLLTRNDGRVHLPVECKRVDPALGVWAFIRNSEMNGQAFDNAVRCVQVERIADQVFARPAVVGHVQTFAHVGVELRAGKGDGTGARGRDMDQAIQQALGGTSGWVNWLAEHSYLLGEEGPVAVLPMIITTAKLLVSDGDLNRASLEEGHVDLEGSDLREVGWLALQHRAGAGMRHDLQTRMLRHTIEEVLEAEAARTIIVANSMRFTDALADLAI